MKIALGQDTGPELEIASLIDMVFLLLIYFMVTASLVKSEGDLGIKLHRISSKFELWRSILMRFCVIDSTPQQYNSKNE